MTLAVQVSAQNSARFASSGGVSAAAGEIDRRLAAGQLHSELAQIAGLAADPETPPSEGAIDLATYYLRCFCTRAIRLGSWMPPHITLSENGEIVFEWWYGQKKITLYFGENTAEYIKVWGTDMDTEMESGVLSDDWVLTSIWLWLHTS